MAHPRVRREKNAQDMTNQIDSTRRRANPKVAPDDGPRASIEQLIGSSGDTATGGDGTGDNVTGSKVTDDNVRGDGRTRRRRRNVDAVLDAVVELAHEGMLDPTSEEIADRAGVSHRSIYRYFESRNSLLEAAMARAFDSVAPRLFFSPVGEGDLDDRIEQFVDARVATYRAFRDVARAAYSRHDPAMVDGIETSRSALRSQLSDQFEPEISCLDPDVRAVTLCVIDAAFQFEALEYLATSGDLDDPQIRQALAIHLQAHLT